MDLGYQGKSVIVTGGGSNIGRSIVLAFAGEGASITIGDLDAEQGGRVVEEAKAAREAFITSTTNFLKPITQIDDAVIGNGEPGETSRRMLGLYAAYCREATAA